MPTGELLPITRSEKKPQGADKEAWETIFEKLQDDQDLHTHFINTIHQRIPQTLRRLLWIPPHPFQRSISSPTLRPTTAFYRLFSNSRPSIVCQMFRLPSLQNQKFLQAGAIQDRHLQGYRSHPVGLSGGQDLLTVNVKGYRRTGRLSPTISSGLWNGCSRRTFVHATRPRGALRKAAGISCRMAARWIVTDHTSISDRTQGLVFLRKCRRCMFQSVAVLVIPSVLLASGFWKASALPITLTVSVQPSKSLIRTSSGIIKIALRSTRAVAFFRNTSFLLK